MKGKKYLERLRILGLTTLKGRRIRGDLIETLFCLETKTFTLRSSSSSQIPVDIREATVWSYIRDTVDLTPGSSSSLRESLTARIPCRNCTRHRSTVAQLFQEAAGWLLPRYGPSCFKTDASMVHHLQVQVLTKRYLQWPYPKQELIRRWDSERELFATFLSLQVYVPCIFEHFYTVRRESYRIRWNNAE